MAVVTIHGKLGGANLTSDRRFRQWAKLIQSPAHTDLTKRGGYAITGPFASWAESVAVGVGHFIVLASETGTRGHHSYDYALVTIGPDDEPRLVTADELREVIATLPDQQRAAAQNSELYAFAAYAHRQLQPGPISRGMIASTVDASPQLLAARRAIEALTEDERRALAAELARPNDD